ncbi:MAG: hypothetical protein FJX53_11510 [Alphaproteobacteria bacterium]|nr:hypothetical protein [Alphaproteobacteria bacterium]
MTGLARIDVPPLTQSLSARLLALTVAFVMLAEVLIYLPSVANFRTNWLAERAAAARLAALAIETMPDGVVAGGTRNEVLRLAGARAIALARPAAACCCFPTRRRRSTSSSTCSAVRRCHGLSPPCRRCCPAAIVSWG